jgi:hypothetical protein
MRRWLGIMLAVLGCTSIAACAPIVTGLTGLSVDPEGHLIIVLAWCDSNAPNGVIVYHRETYLPSGASTSRGDTNAPSSTPPTPSTTFVDDARYSAPDLQGQITAFRLDGPAEGWVAESTPFTPKPGITYSAFGSTESQDTTTAEIEFEASDITKLRPGLVLQQKPDGDTPDSPLRDVVITLKEFEHEALSLNPC